MKKFTEEDLHRLGLMVVENEVVPITGSPDEMAGDEAWWGYGLAQIRFSTELAAQIVVLARKSALHLFRAGHAFAVLRERYKEEGTWMKCLNERKLAHSTVLQAIQLFERAGSEQAIEELTITEAKEKFGIVKPKPRSTAGDSSGPTPRSRPVSQRRPSGNGDGARSPDTNGEAEEHGDRTEPSNDDERTESGNEAVGEDAAEIDKQDPYTVPHQIGMVLDRLAERMKREPVGAAKNDMEAVDQVEARLEALKSAILGAH